jgi:hypothetical protein
MKRHEDILGRQYWPDRPAVEFCVTVAAKSGGAQIYPYTTLPRWNLMSMARG